jgi:hypothetical protein
MRGVNTAALPRASARVRQSTCVRSGACVCRLWRAVKLKHCVCNAQTDVLATRTQPCYNEQQGPRWWQGRRPPQLQLQLCLLPPPPPRRSTAAASPHTRAHRGVRLHACNKATAEAAAAAAASCAPVRRQVATQNFIMCGLSPSRSVKRVAR